MLILLVSCDKGSDDAGAVNGRADISLYAFAVEQTEMDVPATKVALNSVVNSLDFMVYSVADGSYVKYLSVEQSKDDSGFGHIDLPQIPYGDYIVIAVGHNCSVHATFFSPSQLDFGGKVAETFVAYLPLTVGQGTDASQSLMLKRVTGMFVLNVTDTQPADVATVEFLVTGSSTDLNPATGFSFSDAVTVRTVTISASAFAGVANNSFYFNAFLPSDDALVSVVANFKDVDGNILYTRTFPSVTMSPNVKTTYRGAVYSVSSQMSVDIDNSWKDTKLINF